MSHVRSALAVVLGTLFVLPAEAQTKGLSVPLKLPSIESVIEVAVVLLDRATHKEGPPATLAAGSVVFEREEYRLIHRVRDIELESFFTSELLGLEIPGRRVTAKVRVDCLVTAAFDMGRIRVERDPDFTDTFVVVLPAPKLKVEFPDGELADFLVRYGPLRTHLLNADAAAELRIKLYRRATDVALERFRFERQVTIENELPQTVQRLLRARFPGKRISVRLGS